MSRNDELELLKCELKNVIQGMVICKAILSEEEKDHLSLFMHCLSVLERIKVAEEEKVVK